MSANALEFPMCSPSELVSEYSVTFKDSDLLRENDFSQPTKERWQRFYSFIVENLVGVTVDQLGQVPLEAVNPINYMELCEESLPLMTLTLVMQRIMVACEVQDFKLHDIISPKPKRCERMASALLNFIYFRKERLATYEALKEENNSALEKRDQLLKEKDELISKINALKASRKEEEIEIKKFQAIKDSQTAKLTELHKKSSIVKKRNAELKTKVEEQKNTVAQLKQAIAIAKEEEMKLNGMIVQSPDRMKSETEKKKCQVEGLKREKVEKLDRLMSLKKQQEMREKMESNCDQALKAITGLSTLVESDRVVLSDISNLDDHIREKEEELNDVSSKENQIKRLVQSKQERISKLNFQEDSKKTDLYEQLQQLQKEKKHVEMTQTEDEKLKEEMENEIEIMLDEDTQQEILHRKSTALVWSKYDELLKQLDDYHMRVAANWEKVKDSM